MMFSTIKNTTYKSGNRKKMLIKAMNTLPNTRHSEESNFDHSLNRNLGIEKRFLK